MGYTVIQNTKHRDEEWSCSNKAFTIGHLSHRELCAVVVWQDACCTAKAGQPQAEKILSAIRKETNGWLGNKILG